MAGGSSKDEPKVGRTGLQLPAGAIDSTDWPAQLADLIERVVVALRDNTTGRIIPVVRAVVYAAFAVIVGLAVVVVTIVATVRALDAYLPSAVFGDEHTWAAHLVVGLPLTVLGLVCLRQARRPVPADR
jgi:hypothetical protein